MPIDELRYSSAIILVRLLAGATPIIRQDRALTLALQRLKAAGEPDEVERIDRFIWRIWRGAGAEAAVSAVDRALRALGSGDFSGSLLALDNAVSTDPLFAEAWNRRATVHFLLGDHRKAVADIQRVLVLEPRHYGALSGLGQILLREGDIEGALTAFEAAIALNPHLTRITEVIAWIRSSLPYPPVGQELP